MGIKQAISNLAARAVLAALDSSRKCQAAGLKLIAGDTKENVEYIEPYGFTSPEPGLTRFNWRSLSGSRTAANTQLFSMIYGKRC